MIKVKEDWTKKEGRKRREEKKKSLLNGFIDVRLVFFA